jgi:hypothetical protein
VSPPFWSSSHAPDKHWLLSVHPQKPVLVSQTGVLTFPVQSVAFVDEHCMHSPTRVIGAEPLNWHAGAAGSGHAPARPLP